MSQIAMQNTLAIQIAQRSLPSFEFRLARKIIRGPRTKIYLSIQNSSRLDAPPGSRVIQYRVCAIRCMNRDRERARERESEGEGRGIGVGAHVTLLSRIEKNYHIMQIRARAQNTSGSAERSPRLRTRAVAGGADKS